MDRTLTPEQEQAVERREGVLLLSAGAGSGKTSVLVERFVRAVREDGTPPGRILAITFTERAAGELRERIRARLLELGERDAAREAEEAFLTTFHGFCARLLRANPLQAGVSPRFSVLDEGLASRIALVAFRDALRGFQEQDHNRSAAVDLVAAYGADALQRMLLGAHRQLRSQGQTSPRLPPVAAGAGRNALAAEAGQGVLDPKGGREALDAEAGRDALDAEARRACVLLDDLLRRFDIAYRERKRAREALDFDDLELLARDLLRDHPDVRNAWSERFQMLMVDEFQDTNPRQLELLELLARENLFTVGDEQQSIYGFRHADVRLFRARRERLAQAGAALALTHNFRSRPPILAAVERVFSERLGESYTPLLAARQPDASNEDRLPRVELLLTDCAGWEGPAGEGPLWRVAEARLLARRIGELVAGGDARAGEVVVLLRALGDMPLYESALRAAGLPTLATAGDFWGNRQVRELLAYLRTLCNPLDDLALYETLASALVNLSSDALALIARAAREHKCAPCQMLADARLHAVLPASDSELLARFASWFEAERAAAAFRPLAELLRRVIQASGYELHVRSLSWAPRRLANVRKLLAIARGFEAHEGRDLRGFVDHVAHLERAPGGREAEAPLAAAHMDAVRLMSIHSAKGLEFPVVCVADLGRRPTLSVPDLLVEPDGRVGLRLARLGEPELAPALHFAELREQSQRAQQQEEDRILYVAMTRAQERLLLSGAIDFDRWPAPRTGCPPIAWLAPALVPGIASLAESSSATGSAPSGSASSGLPAAATRFAPSGPPAAAARFMPPGPPAAVADVHVQEGLSVRCVLNRAHEASAPAEPLAPELAEPAGPAADRPLSDDHPPASDPPLAADLLPAAALGPAAALAPAADVPPAGDAPLAADRAPAAEAPAGLPLSDPGGTVSYSSLAQLERCGYRYYLERELRLPERHVPDGHAERHLPDGHDGKRRLGARTRGTIVHLLLEGADYGRGGEPTDEQVKRAARRIGVRLGRGECAQIASLVGSALQSAFARRLADARRARREHPFAFSIGAGLPLATGVLDLVAQEPDGAALVVDYKSDALQPEQDLEELTDREYGLQRLLYALACLEGGAPVVHVAHWYLERPAEPVLASFGAGARPELRDRLLARVEEIRDRGFSVSDSPCRGICLTCPGRDTLCPWGETHTLRERSTTLGSPQIAATLTP